MTLNLHAAWIGFLVGSLAGAASGLFFHGENWLGGYASWRRRMIRLAHVAFFGIGFLNLGFALSADALGIESGLALPSILLVVGAVAMPAVCYLSAYRDSFRHFFFVPVLSVVVAVAAFLWRILVE
jgi:hypothetical protein